jgi:hypothetical protein
MAIPFFLGELLLLNLRHCNIQQFEGRVNKKMIMKSIFEKYLFYQTGTFALAGLFI